MSTSVNRKVCVVGLGYVGLPLAVQAGLKGCKVWGIDVNEDLIDTVNKRVSPHALDDWLEKSLKSVPKGNLTATTGTKELSEANVIIICVQTPTIETLPDLSFVEQAAKLIGRNLKRGQLVALESTVNPGITRGLVLPILEEASGLVCGRDFYLAHCPERIDPGNDKYHVDNIKRVVGGVDSKSTSKISSFYESIIDAEIIRLGSSEEAEFVKSWENSHRNVMIAISNNAALICDALGMDINSVLRGMQSKVDQFGLHLARPGLGPGGHCIPEDIHFVIAQAKEKGLDVSLLEASTKLNDSMPEYVIEKLEKALNHQNQRIDELRIGLLGLAYKPGVGDARKSPSIKLGQLLSSRCKELIVHDPFVPYEQSVFGAKRLTDLDQVLKEADIICLATAHDEYVKQLTGKRIKSNNISLVLDGRNALNKEEILMHDILYVGVGR